MTVKQILDEDIVDYKKTSMLIAFPSCTFKCEKECGRHLCHNTPLLGTPSVDIPVSIVISRYMNNPITSAVVCAGLEPFDSWSDLKEFVSNFRLRCDDDIVIYTGYREEEIVDQIMWLRFFKNIVVKFGRFVPDNSPHYDDVLGVTLASDNQYGKRIS